ncbi:hypothetical protein quinque_012982 [Culex quinquefasciatus]
MVRWRNVWMLQLAALMRWGILAVKSDRFIDPEEYQKFPKLFQYDEYEDCRMTYREQYVYCVVRARIRPDDGSELWRNISLFSEDTRHYDHRMVERGICVQNCEKFLYAGESHHEGDHSYAELFRACIGQQLKDGYDLQIEPDVQVYYCYNKTNETPPLVVIIIAILVIYSTAYDLTLQTAQKFPQNYFSTPHKTSQDNLRTAFSFPRNIRRLREPLNTEIRQDLSFLESFRFIQMMRVVLLHIVLALAKMPKVNPDATEHILHRPPVMLYVAEFQNYVQTFFSISGMLLTINFLEHTRKNPHFEARYWLDRLRARLYRIVPAYAFILLLEVSITRRFMVGPLAQQMIGESQTQCRKWWWNNLLFVNNYVAPEQPCLLQTWYLSADMQLFLLGITTLTLIWRWPPLKKYLLTAGILWGICCVAIVTYAKNLPPLMSKNLKLYNDYNFGHGYFQLYIPFHMNITVYFAGMWAGFLYYRFREARSFFFKLQLQWTVLWILIVLYFLSLFTGAWVVQNQATLPALFLALYATWFKHAWGLLSTIMQLRTALSIARSRFRTFFSHPIFAVLGKLCYSFYLIHVTVIMQVLGSAKQPIYFSIRGIFDFFLTIWMRTFLYGALLCLLIELPANVALKELFESKSSKKSPVPTSEK